MTIHGNSKDTLNLHLLFAVALEVIHSVVLTRTTTKNVVKLSLHIMINYTANSHYLLSLIFLIPVPVCQLLVCNPLRHISTDTCDKRKLRTELLIAELMMATVNRDRPTILHSYWGRDLH